MTPKSVSLGILVVEDDPLVRIVIAEHLRGQGHTVLEAGTGEEAISLLRADHQPRIGVVFTDIQLGGHLNGWDVAEAFREAYPDIGVIYASGRYHDGERRVRGSVFFTKPYIPGDIVDAIAEAAQNAETRLGFEDGGVSSRALIGLIEIVVVSVARKVWCALQAGSSTASRRGECCCGATANVRLTRPLWHQVRFWH